MIQNRLGRFCCAREFLATNEMRLVMGAVVVVACEYKHDRFEYLALSPWFDELNGEFPPYYRWTFYRDPISGEGILSVKKEAP